MRVEVNGARIFFDVEGAQFVADGSVMRAKPTLILLPGGPGSDHSPYKPEFSKFAQIAQVIYIDHRGEGRSEHSDAAAWNLAQWGDDVFEFCRVLEIEKPIVMGQSFGGFVAISYATRHPEHPGKLIFSSTAGRAPAHTDRSIELFEKFGGQEVGELARKYFAGMRINPADWVTKAMPLYTRRAEPNPEAASRIVANPAVLMHFLGPGGEIRRFDMLADLARIACPTLVLGGEEDPMIPIEDQEDIAAAIPAEHLYAFRRFPNAGHGPYRDDPAAVFPVIRDFILS